MQPTPYRLSQALWTAFRAAKPVHRQSRFQHTCRALNNATIPWLTKEIPQSPCKQYRRLYSDHEKKSEIDRKAEDAKQRIEQSLESRADIAQDVQSSLKQKKDETIVHTLPEASSIVHKRSTPSDTLKERGSRSQDESKQSDTDWTTSNGKKHTEWATSQWQNSPLPSQVASLRSRATKRFSTFMDSLQSQIVVAAHHLNDLTGYTGIERLKREIEAQESAVQNARQHVKDSRESYTEAIAMRSTTQREVNDLLHRKHAWSPSDLERFTHLYRSDHANEQSEQKAHQQLSAAEAQYEEASTRLAKSILARYHEEQIWSDKIRQMSTWGTWGLMGLNVLLFIVFQIAIEPWRRKRLVRGFEEKVQAALDEKERATDEKFAAIQAQRSGDQIVLEAVQQKPEGVVATAAEEVAQAIADAVTGATDPTEQPAQTPGLEEIENAAEQVAERELEAETQEASLTGATETDASTADASALATAGTSSVVPDINMSPQTWQEQLATTHQDAMKTATDTYTHYSNLLAQQFNKREHVVLSKRELTTRVLEGVAAGIALTCGVMFVFLRAR